MNIENDIFFKNFITAKQNITPSTIRNYTRVLDKFCKATGATLEEAVTKCKDQQEIIIEQTININKDTVQKRIKKFNVNSIESYIKLYYDTYINYCKSKGNKNTSINAEMIMLNSFFKYYDIEIPDIAWLKNDAQDWHLLTKEDFKYVMSESPLMHQCLISLLKSSGIRLGDALSLTWGDIMEYTREYHDCVTLEEFMKKAPQDMIGIMEFYPQKTVKHEILCITGIDPETCNLLLQHLKKLYYESIPLINMRYPDRNAKLDKDSPVFASSRYYFQKAVSQRPMTSMFAKKNKSLQEHRIAIIDRKIADGELSPEDREKEIEQIPRFHAHACRKFFETVISMNCSNLRICALMEGHKPPLATDPHYIKIDKATVRETYMAAIPDLSLENVETKVYTSEIRREMEDKISSLENQVKEKEAESKEMESRLSNIEKLLSDIDNRPRTDQSILEYARSNTRHR